MSTTVVREGMTIVSYSVKETAAQGAENVKSEGSGAADDVRSQVQDSKQNVQNA